MHSIGQKTMSDKKQCRTKKVTIMSKTEISKLQDYTKFKL